MNKHIKYLALPVLALGLALSACAVPEDTTTHAQDVVASHQAQQSKQGKPVKQAPALTTSQENAVGSAQDYLDYTAFSRQGLIDQLSSDAGEGFSVKDATFAVDFLDVNWRAQAVKSAQDYLNYTSFSRQGLIDQLSSDSGEKFTHAQAVYAVNKVGL